MINLKEKYAKNLYLTMMNKKQKIKITIDYHRGK